MESNYWLKIHKFGVKVPNNMKQAIYFNRENGNMLWWDAVCQYMKSVCPTFDPWEKVEGNIPPGYQEIKCHLIFDINMGDNFRQKSRFVVGGHMIDTPAILTYDSVVPRYLVLIALTISDLNIIYIFSWDI